MGVDNDAFRGLRHASCRGEEGLVDLVRLERGWEVEAER